jgi:S1-C subfamily serine protease
MASVSDWQVPTSARPKQEDYGYDLDRALMAVVGVHTKIPEDAFTAETLGTERMGHGVLIRDRGVVLTIGYLVTEAEEVWLNPAEGPPVQGHVLAYDQETGFGLVQALARLDLPSLALGRSSDTRVGEPVVVGGAGGRKRSVAARIAAKQEFAGYWEYVLDEAIFTTPAHPNWGGTALIGAGGDLLGVGSLQMQQAPERGRPGGDLNMIVPIDLLKPILDDMLKTGRANRPQRPWLGLYATEIEDKIVVVGLARGAPAQKAGLKTGDVVLSVGGAEVSDLAGLYRRIWSRGAAGVEVPLTVYRDGRTFEQTVVSSDRNRFFKAPSLH